MDGTRRSRFRRRLGHGKVTEQYAMVPRDGRPKWSCKASATRAAMLWHSNVNSAVGIALFFEQLRSTDVESSRNKMYDAIDSKSVCNLKNFEIIENSDSRDCAR